MNLCRCEQGHFYDKEKYSSCPHCAGGSASDEKRTEAFAEDFTVSLIGEAPDDSAAGGFADHTAGNMGNVVMDVQNESLDERFQTAEDDEINRNVFGSEEDSDHTVGFFDDIFPGGSSAKKKTFTEKSEPKPVANKVSTPCVGWLIALEGEHVGTDFRLKVGKNFVGRSPQMDVALTGDKSVSRESHAIVIYEPKAHIYLVQPGESSSLVYRNNEVLLTPMKLEAYDTITVGDVDLVFMPLCGERFNWEDVLKNKKQI